MWRLFRHKTKESPDAGLEARVADLESVNFRLRSDLTDLKERFLRLQGRYAAYERYDAAPTVEEPLNGDRSAVLSEMIRSRKPLSEVRARALSLPR